MKNFKVINFLSDTHEFDWCPGYSVERQTPRASPSTLVSTIPEIPTFHEMFLYIYCFLTERGISHRENFVGIYFFIQNLEFSLSSSSICKRPAVSKIITSEPFFLILPTRPCNLRDILRRPVAIKGKVFLLG